jgi:hypothetical protein
MGGWVERWQKRTIELRELARHARDPVVRQLLLVLAQEYHEDLQARTVRDESAARG